MDLSHDQVLVRGIRPTGRNRSLQASVERRRSNRGGLVQGESIDNVSEHCRSMVSFKMLPCSTSVRVRQTEERGVEGGASPRTRQTSAKSYIICAELLV